MLILLLSLTYYKRIHSTSCYKLYTPEFRVFRWSPQQNNFPPCFCVIIDANQTYNWKSLAANQHNSMNHLHLRVMHNSI